MCRNYSASTRQPDGTPVAQRTSTTKQYLFGDRLGSITALADDNANSLTRTYSYDPDGNRTSSTTGTGTGSAQPVTRRAKIAVRRHCPTSRTFPRPRHCPSCELGALGRENGRRSSRGQASSSRWH
jgi:hypothetical protein